MCLMVEESRSESKESAINLIIFDCSTNSSVN